MKQKVQPKVNEEYLKAYYDNEANANRHMSFANTFGAVIMAVIWTLYLTGAFEVHAAILPIINVVFPLGIAVLLTPLLYVFFFKDKVRKPRYKYFVLFSFILVIATLNVIIPKHTMIAWALPLIMANHYYNPKVGRYVFVTTLIMMPLCMYAAMFVGEYDPNLIGNGLIVNGEIVYPDGAQARFDLLHMYLEQGDNRYWKIFVYYFIPRSAIISLVFFVCNALNMRTYKLLVDEIHVNSAQEKVRTEIEVAKEIQLATLPSEFVATEEVEIQAELKAAKGVGGDFYDYFVLGDDHVAILIGDVSGKGVPAAMFMMKTITCFKNFISVDRSPSEVMKLVNKTIYEGNDSQMFVTCFLAVVNTKTGEVVFANAGHNPPIVGQKKKFRYLKCQSGFILGGMSEAFVLDERITLQKGDCLCLYTDGITEARNLDGSFYGEERLLNLFNRQEYSCLVELHHQLKDDVLEFVGDAEQSDDMTYITLKYRGDSCAYEEQLFDGVPESTEKILDFFQTFAEKESIQPSFVNSLLVVADELISNIIHHGYVESEGDIFVRLLFNKDKKELVVTLIDTGIPFNPFEVDNKPVGGDVSQITEGGLGILIVKTLMDEYAYDRINGKNIITLKKRF